MKRIAMALLAASLLAGSGVAVPAAASVPTVTAPTVTALSSTLDSDPIAHYGACLAAGGKGDFLLLIDESGSLKQTDPQAARVTAVQYLIRQLATYVDNADVSLDVKFAVFGDSYRSLSDWVPISGSTLPSLVPVADSLASRTSGLDTDYWTALENSRRDLADKKSARGETPSCQAIAWFTDGQLDFDPRTSDHDRKTYGANKPFAPEIALDSEAAAQKLAVIASQLICSSGGLADQIRSSGIVTFVVGLDASHPDFSLVQSIAKGQNPAGGTCGDITNPVPGTFTPASDIDALLFAFDALGSPGQTPIQTEAGICQVESCVSETHKFVLDSSTPNVHILASAEVAGLSASLVSPGGEIISLEPKTVGESSSVTAAGARADYSWQSGKTLSIDLSMLDEAKWPGQWQLAFVDPSGASGDKKSFSNIRIASDFRPTIVQPAVREWFRGDVLKLTLGIVGRDGEAIDPNARRGTMKVSAVLTDAKGTKTVLADSLDQKDLETPIVVDLPKIALGTATLSLELVHTTASTTVDGKTVGGTTLQPQTTDVHILVRPPLDFPAATTTHIDLGVLDGTTTSTAKVVFEGTGCVWLDPESVAVVAAPKEAGDITLTTAGATSAANCVSASAPLPVTFSVENLANGTVNGSVDVLLAPEGETGRAIPATISFTADLRKPFNTGTFALGLILALVLGIGIPVGLVYFAKFLVAKIPARALVSQRVPITVTEDGRVLRDGTAFALRPDDFRDITGIKSGGARSLEVAGASLSTRVTASPSGAGYVVADVPGYVSASDSNPAWVGKLPKARIPLAVHNHWVVLRSPGAPASHAEVILFVSGDASTDRKETLVDDLINRLPDVLQRLMEKAGDAPAEAPQDSGWGSITPSAAPAGFDIDSPSPSPRSDSNSSSGFGFSD